MHDSAGLSELQTRLVTLQTQLTTLEQQQELLLHTLSHDLRTPVMTVLGFTDMLLADIKTATTHNPTKQYLEHVRSAALRQITLVEALLKLSRLRERELQLTSTNVSAVAAGCLQELLPPTTADKHVIHINPTTPVKCDAQLISLVLYELLSNALKFTRNVAEPTISFGVEQQQNDMVFYVRDNGIGFEAAGNRRLFQTFQRLHTQQDYEGAGVGLVTAAMIVQRHGGNIWAESKPDQGAVFYFTLRS